VQQGGSQQFTATVSGTNNPAQSVTWSVSGNNDAETAITSDGLLTVAAVESASALIVRATTTVDPDILAAAALTLFEKATTTYALTVSDSAGGTVSGTGSGSYEAGTSVSVTATPGSGYHFVSWTISGAVITGGNTANPATFTMPANAVTLTATFEQNTATTYALAASASAGGTVSGSGNYASGTVVSVTATPGSGYHFVSWTISGAVITDGNTANPATFTMPANAVTLTATFAQNTAPTYALTVISGSGSGNYAAGAQVTITANLAPSGKVFDKWISANGGSFANANSVSTTFIMPGNAATVTATYKDVPAGAVLVKSIIISGGSSISTKGGTVQLTANVVPANASNKNVTWTSRNTGIATVNASGKVTAKANGTVTIRATAQDGSAVYSEVTITIKGQSSGGSNNDNNTGGNETGDDSDDDNNTDNGTDNGSGGDNTDGNQDSDTGNGTSDDSEDGNTDDDSVNNDSDTDNEALTPDEIEETESNDSTEITTPGVPMGPYPESDGAGGFPWWGWLLIAGAISAIVIVWRVVTVMRNKSAEA
jgi:hypothetical protein